MTIEIDKGENIYNAAKKACAAARKAEQSVQFEFNGLTTTVDPDSHFSDIVTIYNLCHELRRARAGYPPDAFEHIK